MRNLLLGLQSSIVLHPAPRPTLATTVVPPDILSFGCLLPKIVKAHDVRVRQIGLHVQSHKSMFGSVLRNTLLKLDQVGFAQNRLVQVFDPVLLCQLRQCGILIVVIDCPKLHCFVDEIRPERRYADWSCKLLCFPKIGF
jgi:hypothetical protein